MFAEIRTRSSSHTRLSAEEVNQLQISREENKVDDEIDIEHDVTLAIVGTLEDSYNIANNILQNFLERQINIHSEIYLMCFGFQEHNLKQNMQIISQSTLGKTFGTLLCGLITLPNKLYVPIIKKLWNDCFENLMEYSESVILKTKSLNNNNDEFQWLYSLQGHIAQFASELIKQELNADEILNDNNNKSEDKDLIKWLETDLLKNGLRNNPGFNYIDIYEDSDDEENDEDNLDIPELTYRLTPRSQKQVISSNDCENFCQDILDNKNQGKIFVDWMIHHHAPVGKRNIQQIETCVRGAFACILRHHGLLAEAITYARVLDKVAKNKDLSDKNIEDNNDKAPIRDVINTNWKPVIPELESAWSEAQKLRQPLMYRYQKLRRSSKPRLSKEDAYNQIKNHFANSVKFLFSIYPSRDIIHRFDSTTDTPQYKNGQKKTAKDRWRFVKNIFKIVKHFKSLTMPTLLSKLNTALSDRSVYKEISKFFRSIENFDLDKLKSIMKQRSYKALERLYGLRRIKTLLMSSSTHVVRTELLNCLFESLF